MAVWPRLWAQCQGRSPALLDASTLAPSSMSSAAPSSQPSYAALCSGVLPAASTSITPSPAAAAARTAAYIKPFNFLKNKFTLALSLAHIFTPFRHLLQLHIKQALAVEWILRGGVLDIKAARAEENVHSKKILE